MAFNNDKSEEPTQSIAAMHLRAAGFGFANPHAFDENDEDKLAVKELPTRVEPRELAAASKTQDTNFRRRAKDY